MVSDSWPCQLCQCVALWKSTKHYLWNINFSEKQPQFDQDPFVLVFPVESRINFSKPWTHVKKDVLAYYLSFLSSLIRPVWWLWWGARVCQLWGDVNPPLEAGWYRPLPVQCLRTVPQDEWHQQTSYQTSKAAGGWQWSTFHWTSFIVKQCVQWKMNVLFFSFF